MPWGKKQPSTGFEPDTPLESFQEFVTDQADPVFASDEYPCTSCGSTLHFSPEDQALACSHCGELNRIRLPRDHDFREHDLQRAIHGLADRQSYEQVRYAKCHACAAEFEFDPNQHAANCPFCSTAIVADTSSTRHIKPHGVIPFFITEAQARDAVASWLKGLWFAPSKVKAYAREATSFSGVYSPYWTYDSSTRSTYTGHRGDTYYVTTGFGKNRRREPRIRWTVASGTVSRDFDDVLVLASHSLPEKITKNLEHWDLRATRPYQGAYLAGFRSESYQTDVEEGAVEAEAVMDQVIRYDVRRAIGGDHQRISSVHTRHSDQTFKHILLPVWISAFKFRRRTFRYVVNGQTGEVQGERPFSPLKIAFAIILAVFVALLLFALFGASGGFDSLSNGSFGGSFGNSPPTFRFERF